MLEKENILRMTTLIQANQQLFIVCIMLLFVVMILWVLQYLTLKYGKNILVQLLLSGIMLKRYFRQNKRFIKLKNQYPQFFNFCSKRFQRQSFYGLPLTLLFLVMGYILSLFTGLVEDVVTSDSIVTMDYLVSSQVNMLRESSVVNFFILITSLGSTTISCLVVILACVICLTIRQPYILAGLLVSTLGSSIFTFLSKLLFHRIRPTDGLLLEQSYSFPSGHATISIALYGFIAFLAIRFSQNVIRQVHIFLFFIFFAALIGISRIVLNEHYLSDVLGGYLVGTLWLLFGISLTEWLSARNKISWQIHWSVSQVCMVWLSGVCILIATLIYAVFYQFPFLN